MKIIFYSTRKKTANLWWKKTSLSKTKVNKAKTKKERNEEIMKEQAAGVCNGTYLNTFLGETVSQI